jgi:heterodisulfide reductase subunit A-like polyferredoxin
MAKTNPHKDVAVIGAGIAGIKAAFELADLGYKVKLFDIAPDIGGTLSFLDRQFPSDDCGFCKIISHCRGQEGFEGISQTCLRRDLSHPNIELLPLSAVTSLSGGPGEFKLGFLKMSRLVDDEKCNACGKCVEACPIDVKQRPGSLESRKAIYIRVPAGVPRTYTIDLANCTRCGKCVEACPEEAIDLDMKDSDHTIDVGAVVLSPGFNQFDPSGLKQYGYDISQDVITSMELERLLSGLGPTGGDCLKPSDGKPPRSVAFLQCIGSRDTEHNYCSSACCMYTLKEARLLKSRMPELEITIFYMDMRTYGKGYERYLRDTLSLGVDLVRTRPSEIIMDKNGGLEVVFSNEHDEIVSKNYDMAVLAVGQSPPEGTKVLSKIFNLELTPVGFCSSKPLSPVETGKDGIFVCGSFSGPKDIPDTVIEATAVANKIHQLLGSPIDKRYVETQADEERKERGIDILQRVLVIGGRASGLTCAISLAANGVPVDIVEQTEDLGGGLVGPVTGIGRMDVRRHMSDIISRVHQNELVNVHLLTEPESISGHVGNFVANFRTVDETGSREWSENYGAIILASGGMEHEPEGYLYGQDDRVVTLSQFAKGVEGVRPGTGSTYLFILCVNSRDDKRPYCSRTCCNQSLHNALLFKRKDPSARVYVLYRDMMSYGVVEERYIRAKEEGIVFIRYEPDDKPRVSTDRKGLKVDVFDSVLGEDVTIRPDRVILATGVDPLITDTASNLGLPLDPDGFYKEANPKYQPVDTLKAGVFLAGVVNTPKTYKETLLLAEAAASRALSLLSKGRIYPLGAVSGVNERWCSGCRLCEDACPYEARVYVPEKRTVRVIEPLCQGCGVCQMVCPNSTARMEEMDVDEMLEMLEGLVDQ